MSLICQSECLIVSQECSVKIKTSSNAQRSYGEKLNHPSEIKGSASKLPIKHYFEREKNNNICPTFYSHVEREI